MSQKRKILFIITQSEFGGAQRFLSTLVPKLDPEKYTMLVATGSTGDEHFTEHLNNIGIPNTKLRHLVRNPHPWHDVSAIFEIKKLLRTFQPDVLFLLSTKAGFLGALASRYTLHATRSRVIYRIGGWAFNDPQNFLRKKIIITLERLSARWKDYIILNNLHDFLQAKQYHIHPRRELLLIHNGLDVYKMKLLPRDEARKKLGLPLEAFIVGTIAHDYPSKGLQYLKAIHDARYTIHIITNVRHASRYLQAFDVYVSPSVKEGFSWAVLEAMAAKVPVIATRVGAAPEMIEDGKNGFLVEPANSVKITKAILKLQNNDRLRQEFAIQGHQTVLKQFDLDKMVREVEKIF